MNYVCIVGYGAIGPVHIQALEKVNNAVFYAVCDNDPKKLALCEKNNKDVKLYSDFDIMLLDDKITSVHICTPHYLHFEMAKKAIKAGKDVVLEKPVTMLPCEYESLKKLCDESEKRVCIMLQNRTVNSVQEMKKLSQELGKIKGAYASLTWCRDMSYYNHDKWRGKYLTEGGGVLINQAIHLLDMVLYICGDAESVNASASTKLLNIEVEDTLDALITLKNGARVCFYATNTYVETSPLRFEVVFENVILRYEDKTLYKIVNDDIEIIAKDNMNYHGKPCWGNGHDNVINAFYNNEEYPTICDADSTMKTLFAIYESVNKGENVIV